MRFGRCLVTGGTGWLGRYIVATLKLYGNEVVALDRHQRFSGPFDAVIHAAPCAVDPYLALAEDWGHVPVLVVSSGAAAHKDDVYLAGYARLKRQNELVARRYGAQIARPYSILGPDIPLDAHYAASLFLRQAIAGGPVVVKDGAIRSYLYPTDLASALLTILARGDGETYDVGGGEPVAVSDLGRRIAESAGVDCYLATASGEPYDVYLPDLTRLRALGWKQTVSTDEAIRFTLESLAVPV